MATDEEKPRDLDAPLYAGVRMPPSYPLVVPPQAAEERSVAEVIGQTGGLPEAHRSVLDELARLIGGPARQVPRIGIEASQMMKRAFETAAADIERLAQESVDRAALAQQEAISYANVLRQSGELLCGKMEDEAARCFQISEVMRHTKELLGEKPPAAPVAPTETRR